MNITNLKNSFIPNGIKEIWHSEEKDLSPFIAEHLNEISDLIGIQFGEYELEKRVGRYESDIVTNIIGDESVAIVENKINSFDHDHFGKAITYMSYLNAKCIIWICDSFNDEHIKAINYLNKITGDEYSFFGITINVYKFDNDNYSYEFNVIAKPDYIEKSINSSLSEKSIETHNLYLTYWETFKEELTSPLKDIIYIAGRGQNYAPITKKINNVSLNPSISLKGKYARLQVFAHNDVNIDDVQIYLNDNTKYEFIKENGKRDKSLEYLYTIIEYSNDAFETIKPFSELITNVYDALKNYK
jgi:hypothetical protein